MVASRELLIAWLNDTYAIEQAHVTILERYMQDFSDNADIRTELRHYLSETRGQMNDVKECIVSLGGNVTQLTAALSKVVSSLQEASASPYNDEQVKHLSMLHAAAHYEHASYTAVAEAAHSLDEDDIAETCEQLAEQELAMADWATEQLPAAVSHCLATVTEDEQEE